MKERYKTNNNLLINYKPIRPMTKDEEFQKILDTLTTELEPPYVENIRIFIRNNPSNYSLSEEDFDYLEETGVRGMENLNKSLKYFRSLQDENKSGSSSFSRYYSDIIPDIEEALTPTNNSLNVSQLSGSNAIGGTVCSHLCQAGLARKNSRGSYKMTEDIEDYKMVERVVEELNPDRMLFRLDSNNLTGYI